jgi:4-diphosphocytidyl-2-C-methyl-D-erythritol kinase
MSAPLRETAFAKINLALHVRRRREDGYHELETLFAFVDDGDELFVEPADADHLTITGEFAEGLSCGPDNLVLRALVLARKLGSDAPPLSITLDKRLPVAAGLGGGSADAGALLRLILRHWPGTIDTASLTKASAALGADVPACIASETALATGIGEVLSLLQNADTAGLAVLLVNPGIAVATGPVFKAWDGLDRGALAENDSLLARTRANRNDLEAPALSICTEIDEVLTLLRAQLPLVSRMSGSGGTCFALFRSLDAMQSAAIRIADDHPDWWVMGGQLR